MAKLALVICLFVAICGQCFACVLYVDAEADPSQADGSYEHPYPNIHTAIENLSSTEANEVILLQSMLGQVSVFREQIVLEGITQNLTIRSEFDPTSGDFTNLPIKITLPDAVSDPLAQSVVSVKNCFDSSITFWPLITFRGLEITGGKGTYNAGEGDTWGYRGGGFFIESRETGSYNQNVKIDWCKINDNSATWGGGIFLRWSSLALSNSEVFNNYLSYSEDDIGEFFPYIPRGGGAYAHGVSLTVLDTKFYNNRTFEDLLTESNWGNAPALWYEYDCLGDMDPKCEVRSSQFYDNVSILHDSYDYNDPIQGLLSEVSDIHSSSIVAQFTTHNVNHEVIFINNTITNNTTFKEPASTFERYTSLGLNHYLTGFGELKNNIVWNNRSGSAFNLAVVPRQIMGANHPDGLPENGVVLTRVFVTYSDINNAQNLDYYTVPDGSLPFDLHNIDMDPAFCDPTNGNLNLLWNSSMRSPCIMAGYEDVLTPPRFDRIDIGAVQYDDLAHEYINYSFPPFSYRNGLKWMSFPTLDRIWNPTTNDPDVANTFFAPIKYPDILESVKWKVQDDPEQDIHYSEQLEEWVGNQFHYIIPQQGYKIQMAQGLQAPVNIDVPGIIPDVSQYSLTLKSLPAAKNDPYNQYNENWLGYFNNGTSNVEDAFASIIDNLWYIQTQNWTMVREKVLPGSPWIYALQYGKEPMLSYGDMVIVKCFSDAQFTWNTGADNQIPVEKELPIHYVYTEKADYVPFYVELDADDLPSEVALYVDDVCKGAAVVCDSLVEIPGYVLDGVDPNAEVEILAYYENKAAVNRIPTYRVWNPESGTYDKQPLKLSSKNHYYKLKLEKNGDEVPAISETALSIYPNPFNPSTTIKFSLAEPADIKLEIYNQRGQLVKCLTQGKADSGLSSIIWNGTDSHNRKVASGLYYSKLSYNGKSVLKKMILMK